MKLNSMNRFDVWMVFIERTLLAFFLYIEKCGLVFLLRTKAIWPIHISWQVADSVFSMLTFVVWTLLQLCKLTGTDPDNQEYVSCSVALLSTSPQIHIDVIVNDIYSRYSYYRHLVKSTALFLGRANITLQEHQKVKLACTCIKEIYLCQ